MNKYLINIMLLFLLSLLSCEPRSLIIFEDTIHDFGRIKTETSVKHTFNFKNAGNGILYIERIKTS